MYAQVQITSKITTRRLWKLKIAVYNTNQMISTIINYIVSNEEKHIPFCVKVGVVKNYNLKSISVHIQMKQRDEGE